MKLLMAIMFFVLVIGQYLAVMWVSNARSNKHWYFGVDWRIHGIVLVCMLIVSVIECLALAKPLAFLKYLLS